MLKLSDITIGRKMILTTAVIVAQLVTVTGFAVHALTTANTAASKVAHYADKLRLATLAQCSLSELALHMSNLPNAKQPALELDAVLASRKNYLEALAYLSANATTEEDRNLLSKINDAITPWREVNNQIMQAIRARKHVDASRVSQESVARYGAVKLALADYVRYRQRRLDLFQQEQQSAVSAFRWWMAGIGVFCVIATTLLNRKIALSLAVPLRKAAKLMASFADGDLTGKITPHSLARKDEIGMLAAGTQAMVSGLRSLAASMNEGIGVLTSASAELAVNSRQMSDGSDQVSGKAHSVATAAEQMTANIASVAGAWNKPRTLSAMSLPPRTR